MTEVCAYDAEHWTLTAKPQAISERRYLEMLECLPPVWWSGDRFAVGEPYSNAGSKVTWPCCFKLGDQAWTANMPAFVLKRISNDALRKLVCGEFVVRDGMTRGYVFVGHECWGRYSGELVSIDGLSVMVKGETEHHETVMREILKKTFDICAWREWDQSKWDVPCGYPVGATVDIV